MPARQDLQKRHHGRRKRGSRWRKRMWAFHHKHKLRKLQSKRRGRKRIRR